MTMKRQKTIHRFAAVAAVLLMLCLVFMIPVGAAEASVVEVGSAAAAQAALDEAGAGTTIQLISGVDYGTLVFGQNINSKSVDVSNLGGDEPDSPDNNERYSKYEDITIIGADGATVDQITFNIGRDDEETIWNYIDVKNLVIQDVTFSGTKTAVMIPDGFDIAIDGLSIVNCEMTDSDGDDRFVYQPHAGYKTINDKTTGENVMTHGVKDLTITGCKVTGAHQVIEARPMKGITITGNTFKSVSSRDILLSVYGGCTYSGTITITGNTADSSKERFVRASGIGDATVIIKDNIITNYLGADDDYIKVDGISSGTVTISGNYATAADGRTTLTTDPVQQVII